MPDPNPLPTIALKGVHKRFAGGVEALAEVSLEVCAGDFVALLGPSGCGKSTVLRLVAGLDDASAGEVRAPARSVVGEVAGEGQTAFVFQEPTLMPWASVFDNVWLPLRLRGVSRADALADVQTQLAAVGLSGFEQAYPAQLSGGMKMRASIARALVTQPAVLLMDEPFAALDDITRHRLNADLLQWWQRLRPATVFVTHSIAEAVFLSQRVLVMAARPGRILTELDIAEPYPRTPAFRHTPAFHLACRTLADAMEAASPEVPAP